VRVVIDQKDAVPVTAFSARRATPAPGAVAAASSLDRGAKLVLDIVLTLVGLTVLAPVLIALAVIVKLDSPGPVIHRRRVMGMGGGTFDAFKFRTMVTNGDEVLARTPGLKEQLQRDHKLVDDPRITRSGSWMRKLSLDELPQLFNVLRGEMSLIGPRMISPPELERYGEHGAELLTVRPGISGLWQVSGRSNLAAGDRVRLDMHYIRTRNVFTDIVLILKTIPAVLKSRGAY
jgi:lipopolysaccharide/colanic/teichoic acid biosynthesis glycosyltransferase